MSIPAIASFSRLPQIDSANKSAATSAFLDALKAQTARQNQPAGSLASALPAHRHHHGHAHAAAQPASASAPAASGQGVV